MEFPELGVHCAEPTCARLDFLPFTCDACHKVFCLDHKTYEQHHCQESYAKDVQVPVCPLCNQPVPTSRGGDPNAKVDQHIRNDCRSEAAKKLYVNKCSYRGCKKKEVVQVNCSTCGKRFCLKHRLETAHDCEGPPNKLGKRADSTHHPPHAANRPPQTTTLSAIGADLNKARMSRQRMQQPNSRPGHQQPSEDEAMAAAIAASLQDSPPDGASSSVSPDQQAQMEEDEALARAVEASLREARKPKQAAQKREQSDDTTCSIS